MANMTAIGQAPGYADSANTYRVFLERHSGGIDGRNLQDLDSFEKTLQVKRKIRTQDMKLLANVDLEYEAPRYATAMMKAMLASPACFCEQGFSTNFAPGGFSKLCYGGKSRPNAITANVLMNNAQAS